MIGLMLVTGETISTLGRGVWIHLTNRVYATGSGTG
jgi:hypothetical protein